jgi:hypothetical protein
MPGTEVKPYENSSESVYVTVRGVVDEKGEEGHRVRYRVLVFSSLSLFRHVNIRRLANISPWKVTQFLCPESLHCIMYLLNAPARRT